MILFVLLALPFIAALVSLLPFGTKWRSPVSFVLALAALALSVSAILRVETSGGIQFFSGAVFCDGFSALMILLTAFVGMGASLFSWGYLNKKEYPESRIRIYYFHFNLFFFSILAVPIFGDPLLAWVAVELTSLFSVFLVYFENTHSALEASWKYVILTLMGASIALLGFFVLFLGLQQAGHYAYTWGGLFSAAPHIPPVALKAAFLLVLAGLGTKVGLIPLHTWFPDAYREAPSPVCALLSGVETSAVLYVILRLIPILHASSSISVELWIIPFGLLSVGVGAFLLLRARSYKELFAFSTIEQMGIIVMAAGIGGNLGSLACVYQILSHAVVKTFCFFAAGSAELAVGEKEMVSVRGLSRVSPVAGFALLFGGLSIAGMPPSPVFFSELSIVKAGLFSGNNFSIVFFLVFVGVAFVGTMLHVNRIVFGAADRPRTRLPVACLIALVTAFVPLVVLGFYMPDPILKLLKMASMALVGG